MEHNFIEDPASFFILRLVGSVFFFYFIISDPDLQSPRQIFSSSPDFSGMEDFFFMKTLLSSQWLNLAVRS